MCSRQPPEVVWAIRCTPGVFMISIAIQSEKTHEVIRCQQALNKHSNPLSLNCNIFIFWTPLKTWTQAHLEILPAAATGQVLHYQSVLRANRRSIFLSSGPAPAAITTTAFRQKPRDNQYRIRRNPESAHKATSSEICIKHDVQASLLSHPAQ